METVFLDLQTKCSCQGNIHLFYRQSTAKIERCNYLAKFESNFFSQTAFSKNLKILRQLGFCTLKRLKEQSFSIINIKRLHTYFLDFLLFLLNLSLFLKIG